MITKTLRDGLAEDQFLSHAWGGIILRIRGETRNNVAYLLKASGNIVGAKLGAIFDPRGIFYCVKTIAWKFFGSVPGSQFDQGAGP
jgi:hypothetical protein